MKNKIKVIIFVVGLFLIVFGADRVLKMQGDINQYEDKVVSGDIDNYNKSGEIEFETEGSKVEFVKEITSENFEKEVLKSDKKVLIDFYATWCMPCKILSPTVEEIAKENENIKVVKIDIDKEVSLANKYGIISIPTLVIVESGEIKNGAVGVISKESILNMINR